MTNKELKYYEKLKQKKYRDSESKFLIEGIHLLEECLKSEQYKDRLEKIFVRNNFRNDSFMDLLKKTDHSHEVTAIEDKAFSRLSETVNSQGIIAAVNKPSGLFSGFTKSGGLITALDNINDPGNLGTILRTCYWFGVNEILISKNSADIYNSKTVRASQGALFNLKIRNELNLEKELEKYSEKGMKIFLSVLNSVNTPEVIGTPVKVNTVIVFGNEANGISQEILDSGNYTRFSIKGCTECESLNVSVAAGIVLDRIRNG